ncbi:MAG TPA: glycosyltransferase family 87 protein [Sporichthya sp.]|nr:glycosyltransferase family 87 protein [Sporichthya sp.]
MSPRARLSAAGAALAALVGAQVAALRIGLPDDADGRRLLLCYALGAVAFVAGAWLVRGLPTRRSLQVAVAGGVLLQAVAVCYSPTTTDDYWRYLWDGKVQAAGIDPYGYAPLDPALADLRDAELFPPDSRTPVETAGAQAEGRTDHCTIRGVPHDCTEINRPNVHTIYPPVAEAAFLGMHYLSPDTHRVVAFQIAMGLLALGVAAALIWALRRSDRDPRGVVWWTWCPVVWLECANNAHIDVLGVLLLVLALGVLTHHQVTSRRLGSGGALFGAAVAVKLVPVLVAPVLLFRRGHLVLAAATGVFVAGYLPHLLFVGTDVLGYLPGYLQEEGYSGEERFGVVRLLVPDRAAPAVAVLIGATIAAWVLRRAVVRARPDAEDALLLVGAAFVLVGPSQTWYGLIVVALAVLVNRPEWLALAAAAYPVYQAGHLGVDNSEMQQRAYLPAALFVAAVTLLRRRRRGAGPGPASARPADATAGHPAG